MVCSRATTEDRLVGSPLLFPAAVFDEGGWGWEPILQYPSPYYEESEKAKVLRVARERLHHRILVWSRVEPLNSLLFLSLWFLPQVQRGYRSIGDDKLVLKVACLVFFLSAWIVFRLLPLLGAKEGWGARFKALSLIVDLFLLPLSVSTKSLLLFIVSFCDLVSSFSFLLLVFVLPV